MKYRKKPVVIEAVQWNGRNLEEIKEFVGDSLICEISDAAWKVGKGAPSVYMEIKTLEGNHKCSIGDYIIKGVQGEFYPCKPDIFKKTYEQDTDDLCQICRSADCANCFSDEDFKKWIDSQPQIDGLYTRHEVACIIADLFGGTCACDYSGNDEWLPQYCDFAETVCPHPSGVACWEQYLLHKDKREERDD